jgi:hypothetical protein
MEIVTIGSMKNKLEMEITYLQSLSGKQTLLVMLSAIPSRHLLLLIIVVAIILLFDKNCESFRETYHCCYRFRHQKRRKKEKDGLMFCVGSDLGLIFRSSLF